MRLLKRFRRTRPLPADAAPVMPPVLRMPRAAAWWIVPITLLVGAVVGGVSWWLLSDASSTAAAIARQGALQTALAAGAGVGAAVTLMLAFRRQHHQERTAAVTADLAERNVLLAKEVAEHTKHDATERRVTDLYVKAAEQLGHDQAAVRLAGLYALERLAQDNPGQRQTIVNVICAYLRMPYTPPRPADPEQERKAALREARRRYHATHISGTSPTRPALAPAEDLEGERQVRLTAQRILSEHLRDERPAEQRDTTSPGPRFWPGMRIDLTGATLIDLDFSHCHIAEATFTKATFTGDARFSKVTFTGDAEFGEATFAGDAWFRETFFSGRAHFGKVTFTRYAHFGGATFAAQTWPDKAAFPRDAFFGEAPHIGFTWFGGATFTGHVWFDQVTFAEGAFFGEATFTEGAGFNKATFTERAWFGKAIFTGLASFGGATFTGQAQFIEVTFAKGVEFNEAIATASDGWHVWPAGWWVSGRSDGSGVLVREGED
ncbi:pentapeptide repeat-containing protein [Streptosporangium longisporum]|uniref:Pentapeptide repeat-containing protein n=1 Tax=Streptosporangium longisporum TaxID=46187 RepID=A0ABN3XS20_9ACTN